MQQFPCPFCGLRDEREFHYAGEAGNTRPDTLAEISDEEWENYLFNYDNPKGTTREVWVHTPCQEYFVLERDTVTMEVASSASLRRDIS